jgi:hypothetical protein
MNPRVRIAAVSYSWDLFSPVTSFTFDYSGLYFMAGNNPGATDSDLELSKSPTYSARASYDLPAGRAGASAIYSRL